jgi:hypothetical protein
MTFLKQVATGVLVAFVSILIVSASLLTTFVEDRLDIPLSSAESQVTPPCPIPSGWIEVELQEEDSLRTLAQSMGLNEEDIKEGNCLTGVTSPGDTVYVPLMDLRRGTDACGPPQGWHFYTVEAMENLEMLALRFNISEAALRQANCLTPSYSISVGERIFLPLSPSPTATIVDEDAETPSPESLPTTEETPVPTESS